MATQKFTLNKPVLLKNRLVLSWAPRGFFRESSFWVEYPDLTSLSLSQEKMTEAYFPVCVALACLGDVEIELPFAVPDGILQNWERYLEAVSRACFRKKIRTVFKNGKEISEPKREKGTETALLFGGGAESLLVLSRLLKEGRKPVLVSAGGPGWAGSDPDQNPHKAQMDHRVSQDLGLKLLRVLTNFRDVIHERDWNAFVRPWHSLVNAALLNPLLISLVAPATGNFGIGKLVQGNEKMSRRSSEYFCFTPEAVRLLRNVASDFEYDSYLEDLYKEEVCRELYEVYPHMARYQYSCWQNHRVRWCHQCESCLRYYVLLKLHGLDPSWVGMDESEIGKNKKRLVLSASKSEESFPGEIWERLYKKRQAVHDPLAKYFLNEVRRTAWIYHRVYDPLPECVREFLGVSRFLPSLKTS